MKHIRHQFDLYNETFKLTNKCRRKFCFKTAELDPARNYLAGCHPHGVFAIGAFAVYGCDALEWDKLFVGINRQFVTLEVNMSLSMYFCWWYIRFKIYNQQLNIWWNNWCLHKWWSRRTRLIILCFFCQTIFYIILNQNLCS